MRSASGFNERDNPAPPSSEDTITSGPAGFAAGGTYGLINPVSDGFFGTMMPGQEVYGFLGLTANNSNSFTNWFGVDDEYLGLAPTSFDIHAYALNADLGPNGLINVALTRNVSKGTFIVAYGQGNWKNFAVPFTRLG